VAKVAHAGTINTNISSLFYLVHATDISKGNLLPLDRMSRQHIQALRRVLFAQLATIQDTKLSEEVIESLLLTCGDSMLLAALDLIDSADGKLINLKCLDEAKVHGFSPVSRVETPAGRSLYRVCGQV
jgi:hypothetical protein